MHRSTIIRTALTAVLASTLAAAAPGDRRWPLPETRNYTRWTRVNPTPVQLPDPTALLCRNPMPGEDNPHRGPSWFTVFVNEKGAKPLRQAKKPAYPVGTVLVKEKLPEKKATVPELRTVMIKREKGFDAKAGDWEYATQDADGTVTRDRKQMTHCRSCHEKAKDQDYVFRTYLPQSLRKALR